MTDRLNTVKTAKYLRGEAVIACPPQRREQRDAKINEFADHIVLMAGSPSVFDPRACIEHDLPRVRAELERLDWNSNRWHVLDRKGAPKDSLAPEEMAIRYRPCPLDPFMFAPAEAELIEIEARVRGYEPFFSSNGIPAQDPLALFDGLIRADDLGHPQMPADVSLFIQVVSLLRSGDAPWAKHHLWQLEVLWRLLRTAVTEESAFADMRATVDLLDHREHVRSDEDQASAVSRAANSATIALLEIYNRGGSKPSLVPPRASWRQEPAQPLSIS